MASGSHAIAFRQAALFQSLWLQVASHVRTDRALPARFERVLRQHRGFGSRDRRLYRELFYTTLRFLPWLEAGAGALTDDDIQLVVWLSASLPATQPMKEALTAKWPALPPRTSERAALAQSLGRSRASASLLPDWFKQECPTDFSGADYDSLTSRAPLWIRLQTGDPTSVEHEFSARGWTWDVSKDLPEAWRLATDVEVESTQAFLRGQLEVQDIGSQWVLHQARPQKGEQWLDACAGAGGKTLQLARLVGPEGTVIAHDIRPAALTELHARTSRARLGNVRSVYEVTGTFDAVLVDAPCSGTGTWRRAPHLKWSTHSSTLTEMSGLQSEILKKFAPFVRPGGRLVYATCSLARSENEEVVTHFLQHHPQFSMWPRSSETRRDSSPTGSTLLPSRLDSDGFFVATLERSRT
jgi:16S rRNA (cytosine967-C5)-methyltransferase